jgi:hypothetical protein
MVTMRDVERAALAMPEATKELRDDDRPAYVVKGKLFCFHRTQRRDAIDPVSGERMNDVFVFRVADEEMKAMWLAARPDVFFTTDHFNGYAAILTRIPSLAALERDDLFELISDAWLSQAPKRLAANWLASQGVAEE